MGNVRSYNEVELQKNFGKNFLTPIFGKIFEQKEEDIFFITFSNNNREGTSILKACLVYEGRHIL